MESTLGNTVVVDVEPLAKTTTKPFHIGPYLVESEIGRGAMGAVYRATHTKLKREVALKVLPNALNPHSDRLVRFHREMEAVGQLDHPNIVRATDAGEFEGVHYLAMEFVPGRDLEYLVDEGRFDCGSACEAMRQTALGLQHIHDNKLVHRDVKPSNLLLANNGTIKILDLGIAMLRHHEDDSVATSAGSLMGTPDFMAPEQIQSTEDVDIRADIYSLGCTLYNLLAGRPPYHGPKYDSQIAKFIAHSNEAPRPLSQVVPDMPKEVERIVDRMMAKNPADRYQTPQELAEALAPWAESTSLIQLAGGVRSKSTEKTIVSKKHLWWHRLLSYAVGRQFRGPAFRAVLSIGVGVLLGIAIVNRHSVPGVSNEIRETLDSAKRELELISEPRSPGQFYHNARLLEQQANYVAAREQYRHLFGLESDFVDVHQHFQQLLKLQEGLDGARRVYTGLPGDSTTSVRRYAIALLYDLPERERQLSKLISDDPNFAPAYYELSGCYSEASLGAQSLYDKAQEKHYLEEFLSLCDQGYALRNYLDYSKVASNIDAARQRLATLKLTAGSASDPPVTLTAAKYSDGWKLEFHIAEPVRKILYRLNPSKDFMVTELTQYVDPRTGERAPQNVVLLPKSTGECFVEVKYLDVRTIERGPFTLRFDPKKELIRHAKRALEITKTQWVRFGTKRYRDRLEFAHLGVYKDVISEVRYGVDQEDPSHVHKLPDVNRDGTGGLYVSVAPDALFAVVQLQFLDGTVTDAVRFERREADR